MAELKVTVELKCASRGISHNSDLADKTCYTVTSPKQLLSYCLLMIPRYISQLDVKLTTCNSNVILLC